MGRCIRGKIPRREPQIPPRNVNPETATCGADMLPPHADYLTVVTVSAGENRTVTRLRCLGQGPIRHFTVTLT